MKKIFTLTALSLFLITIQVGARPVRPGKRNIKEQTKETINEKKRISETEWQNNCLKAKAAQNARFKTTPYPYSTEAETVPVWVPKQLISHYEIYRSTIEHTYDEEGLMNKAMETLAIYQGNQTYANDTKRTKLYDKQGRINTESIELFSDNQWNLSGNEKWTYEERNDSMIVTKTLHAPTGESINKEIDYYETKNKTQIGKEVFGMYDKVWVGLYRWYSLTEPQINNLGEKQGTVTTRTEQRFENGQWIDSYVYIDYGYKGYREGALNKYWNNEIKQWDVNGNIRTVKINSQKLPIEEINEMVQNNIYTIQHHSWKEYDNRGNMTLSIDSSSYEYSKGEYTYLPGTDLRTSKKRSVKTNEQWQVLEESTYAYDQGRLIEEIYSDYYNGKLDRYKDTYTYDNTTGLPTESNEYVWLNAQNRYMLVYRSYDYVLQPCTLPHTPGNPGDKHSFECLNDYIHLDETMIGLSRMEQAIEETDESEEYTGNEILETYRYTASLDNAGRLIEEKTELVPSDSHTKSYVTTITYNEKGLCESSTDIDYVDGIITEGEKQVYLYDSANTRRGSEYYDYNTETSSWEMMSRNIDNMNIYNADGTLAANISENYSPGHKNGRKFTYQYLTQGTGQKIVTSYFEVGGSYTDWTELERFEHQINGNGNTQWQQRYAIDNNTGRLTICSAETENRYFIIPSQLICNNRLANIQGYPLGWKNEASFIQVMRDANSLEQSTTSMLLRSNDATVTGEVTIIDPAVTAWQLFNTNGNLVSAGSEHSVYLGHLPSGIYLLSAKTNDSIRIVKIVR